MLRAYSMTTAAARGRAGAKPRSGRRMSRPAWARRAARGAARARNRLPPSDLPAGNASAGRAYSVSRQPSTTAAGVVIEDSWRDW